MRFIHIADMHFDTSFTTLTNKADLGDLRRLDQRAVFRKVIDYIKQNDIPFLFISGDLYEHEYIRQSTIEFINNLFKEIANTQVFISPGNHDPYLNNSFYNKYYWNENVHIFTQKIDCVELENVDIYGYGFGDFYDSNSEIENIKLKDSGKINILVTHGTLNGSATMERDYNPISKNKIKEIGFDYVALGHIHKLDYNSEINQRIVYPGSLISLGFDELGEHGMIAGEIQQNKNIKLQFIPLDNKEFKIIQIDATELLSNDELIEKINGIQINENQYYKIELIGKRNFEIDTKLLEKLIISKNIIKIKNFTKLNYNIEQISNENTLKGLFAREILQLKNEGKIDEDTIEQTFEIGLDVLEK